MIPPFYHVEAFPVPKRWGVAGATRINAEGTILGRLQAMPGWSDENRVGGFVVGSRWVDLPAPGRDLNDRGEVLLDDAEGATFRVWRAGRTQTRHARGLPVGAAFSPLALDAWSRAGGKVERWNAKAPVREGAAVVAPDGTARYLMAETHSVVGRFAGQSAFVSVGRPPGSFRSFRITDRVAEPLPDSERAVSPTGRTVAFFGSTILWCQGAERWLDRPAYDNVEVEGVNDAGLSVGSISNVDPTVEDPTWEGERVRDAAAIVWEGERAYRLNERLDLPGAFLWRAEAVNARGQIAGTGVYRGRTCVFRLTPKA